MKSRKYKEYEPNKAYPTSGMWIGTYNRVKHAKGKPIWIRLEVTPDLFSHVHWSPVGIVEALEKGYLEIEASHMGNGNVRLSVLIDENMGDEDGFGVEPDDYLEGIVAPDGSFVEPLHIR